MPLLKEINMKIKKDKKQDEENDNLEEFYNELSDIEKDMVDESLMEATVYAAVFSKLKIDPEDEAYRIHVLDILKRQTHRHIVFAIWKNISTDELVHFKDYLDAALRIQADVYQDDVLIEFALLYPKLMEKVNKSLAEFFDGFVAKFNELLDL